MGRQQGIAEEGELFRTHIGGSALTEGIMMRGKLNWAVAVREPSGRIHVETHDLPNPETRAAWKRWPIVRGCVAFVESVALSMRAMSIAADHAYDAEGETWESLRAKGGVSATPAEAKAGAQDQRGSDDASPEGLPPALLGASMAVGLVLGVALFVALPVAVANLVVGDYGSHNAVAWNLVEAALRIAVFVAYVAAIGLAPDMARVFGYHGAEHQTIHCFEHGVELTPGNCAGFSRLHVRCGTAFIIMTMIVAIVVNTLVPVSALADALGLSGLARMALVLVSRLAMLPLVAGLSYEVTVKWAGSHPESPLVRVVLWPGLKMQLLTTRVPDEEMLECAIEALARVRDREVAAGLDDGLGCCR